MNNKVISIRTNDELFERINEEAQKNGITISSMTHKILNEYVTWHSNTIDAGLFPISKTLFSEIVRHLGEKELSDVKKTWDEQACGSITEFLMPQSEAIHVFEQWLVMSGFSIRKEQDDQHITFTVKHDLGAEAAKPIGELTEIFHSSRGWDARFSNKGNILKAIMKKND